MFHIVSKHSVCRCFVCVFCYSIKVVSLLFDQLYFVFHALVDICLFAPYRLINTIYADRRFTMPAVQSVQVRGMFEMNCLFLSGDFEFQVSPKVLISCPRSTPRG